MTEQECKKCVADLGGIRADMEHVKHSMDELRGMFERVIEDRIRIQQLEKAQDCRQAQRNNFVQQFLMGLAITVNLLWNLLNSLRWGHVAK
jgi:hypothetical protein